MENDKQILANKTFGKILSDGLNLFIKCYWKLFFPLALFQIISISLQVLLLTDIFWLYYKFGNIMIFLSAFTLFFLIGLIFNVIAMSTVSNYVYKKYMEENTDFINDFKGAFNSKLLLVTLILGVCMGLAFSPFVLFFPGFIIFGYYIFLIYTYNLEDTKENPILEARSIAKGSFWNILFIFALSMILIWVINFIYQLILLFTWDNLINDSGSWINPATRNYSMLILNDLIHNLVNIILAPLFISLFTPLFARCKARKELGIQYRYQRANTQKAAPYYQPHPTQPPYQVVWESEAKQFIGMFCPYCGYKINTPKKFCPNCGESIKDLYK